MVDSLHELRLRVLEAATTGARLGAAMAKEDVDRWARRKSRERGQLIMGVIDELPKSTWVSFSDVLKQFEAAVREDERGCEGA